VISDCLGVCFSRCRSGLAMILPSAEWLVHVTTYWTAIAPLGEDVYPQVHLEDRRVRFGASTWNVQGMRCISGRPPDGNRARWFARITT